MQYASETVRWEKCNNDEGSKGKGKPKTVLNQPVVMTGFVY